MILSTTQNITIELSAVIMSVEDGAPRVMLAEPGAQTSGRAGVAALPALPSGPFETGHRTLEQGLRDWAAAGAAARLGYVEQLYTFADKDRARAGTRVVSIGYLALGRFESPRALSGNFYDFFPWEDLRGGWPRAMMAELHQALTTFRDAAPDPATRRARAARIAVAFPREAKAWDEELVLQRYELLWEAGLIHESAGAKKNKTAPQTAGAPGLAMAHDHRRILATGIARLRAKIKYRPVVFELLPERFTLRQLQETVEALAGIRLHTQNFRRLVLSQGLVEETKAKAANGRGRPATFFTFRAEVLRHRAASGTKLPRSG